MTTARSRLALLANVSITLRVMTLLTRSVRDTIKLRQILAFVLAASFATAATAAPSENESVDETKQSEAASFDPTSGYEPQTIQGWQVLVNKRLDAYPEIKKAALREIESQLYRVGRILPAEMLARLQKTRIWVEKSARDRTAYHPNRQWLEQNGYNPDKTRCVEITNAEQLVAVPRFRPEIVLLHELVHAYHDQVLGFDHPEIVAAYDRAVKEKKYEDVLHIRGVRMRHYALTNHKEFFAELSEAYLIANDYYPFVRPELKTYDPETYALLEKIWTATEK